MPVDGVSEIAGVALRGLSGVVFGIEVVVGVRSLALSAFSASRKPSMSDSSSAKRSSELSRCDFSWMEKEVLSKSSLWRSTCPSVSDDGEYLEVMVSRCKFSASFAKASEKIRLVTEEETFSLWG